MIDSSLQCLQPYLQQLDRATLWFADENALALIAQLPQANELTGSEQLWIATNRYDIYQQAQQKGYATEFNDFTLAHYTQTPARVLYRVSKERALAHHLINQAATHLPTSGECILSGKKQEGIKSYATKLKSIMGAVGKLQKSGLDYSGCFTDLDATARLDDQHYNQIQQLSFSGQRRDTLYSKPGVFGWQKIDQGSELLLHSLPDILQQQKIETPLSSILDLGCGYGWLFLNLPLYIPDGIISEQCHIVATDNNASALLCARKNAETYSSAYTVPVDVIPSDCANTLQERFPLIVCNPPFHQGFMHDKQLSDKFLRQTQQHLTPTGIAVFVVNEFIGLQAMAAPYFTRIETITCAAGFKVVTLQL